MSSPDLSASESRGTLQKLVKKFLSKLSVRGIMLFGQLVEALEPYPSLQRALMRLPVLVPRVARVVAQIAFFIVVYKAVKIGLRRYLRYSKEIKQVSGGRQSRREGSLSVSTKTTQESSRSNIQKTVSVERGSQTRISCLEDKADVPNVDPIASLTIQTSDSGESASPASTAHTSTAQGLVTSPFPEELLMNGPKQTLSTSESHRPSKSSSKARQQAAVMPSVEDEDKNSSQSPVFASVTESPQPVSSDPNYIPKNGQIKNRYVFYKNSATPSRPDLDESVSLVPTTSRSPIQERLQGKTESTSDATTLASDLPPSGKASTTSQRANVPDKSNNNANSGDVTNMSTPRKVRFASVAAQMLNPIASRSPIRPVGGLNEEGVFKLQTQQQQQQEQQTTRPQRQLNFLQPPSNSYQK